MRLNNKFLVKCLISTLLIFFKINIVTFSQQSNEPLICSNPTILGPNYISGGAFDINKYSCLSEFTVNTTHTATSPSGITPGSQMYNFNFTDATNIVNVSTSNTSLFAGAGKYWVLQEGKIGLKNAIYCNSIEVIQTHRPEIDATWCGNLALKITIKATVTNNYHNQYFIDWGDGKQETIVLNGSSLPFGIPEHRYTKSPTSLPFVVGKYVRDNAVVCSSVAKYIDINDYMYISELKGLNAGKDAQIVVLNGKSNNEYVVQYKKISSTTWVDYKETLKYGIDKGELVLKDLSQSDEYCFRVKEELTGCGLTSYTNEVCTIVPSLNTLSSSAFTINWNKPNGEGIDIQDYKISLTDSENATYPIITSKNNTFTQSPLKCKVKYTFSVSTDYNFNKYMVSIKSPNFLIDTETQKQLSPILVGAVSIEQSKIFVDLSVPDSFEPISYTFYRADNGQDNFKEVAKTANNFLVESDLDFSKNQYCYKVDYTNICGVKSELSPSFCSVFLSLENSNILNWTPIEITNVENVVSSEKKYNVKLIDGNGSVRTVNTITNTNYKFSEDAIIRDELLNTGQIKMVVEAVQDLEIDYYGLVQNIAFSVNSNEIEIYKPITFYIPNVFTPDKNGPLENEVFSVKGDFLTDIEMIIYNRWGNVIFENRDLLTGWSGLMADGLTPSPAGEYSYKITCKDKFNQILVKVGVLTLLR